MVVVVLLTDCDTVVNKATENTFPYDRRLTRAEVRKIPGSADIDLNSGLRIGNWNL